MVVSAAGHQPQAARLQRLCERSGVGADVALVVGELRRHSLAECDRFRGDDMLQRPALHIGEHGAVHRASVGGVAQD